MDLLKQSTADTLVIGPFLDETDGFTPLTSLTIEDSDVQLSKNAAAFGDKNDTTTCTHLANGYYSCPIDATDSDTLERLLVAVNATGALPVWHEFTIVPANVYDSMILGTDKLDANMAEIDGNAAAAARQRKILTLIPEGSVAADGGNSVSQFKCDLTVTVNNRYKDRQVYFLDGALDDEEVDILSYDGSTKIITCTPATSVPADGQEFVII